MTSPWRWPNARTEARRSSDHASIDRAVDIPVDGGILPGHLLVPVGADEIVVFVHGSGSSRHSPRNRWVAERLNERGLGTLLFDLLTPGEELDRRHVFDIDLLGTRLDAAIDAVRSDPALGALKIGLFGASTGAAAALWEASRRDRSIVAVVSRGGRVDLAAEWLPAVRAPTLLIVGGRDAVVLELNREASRLLHCDHHLAIVSGASHLFEERDALAQVARLAGDWFLAHP